jgi:hypothetical protein
MMMIIAGETMFYFFQKFNFIHKFPADQMLMIERTKNFVKKNLTQKKVFKCYLCCCVV